MPKKSNKCLSRPKVEMRLVKNDAVMLYTLLGAGKKLNPFFLSGIFTSEVRNEIMKTKYDLPSYH